MKNIVLTVVLLAVCAQGAPKADYRHVDEKVKAAVALAGCHDNRVDKLWWNEQWMGYPLGPWYADNSNVTHAHRLKGDLLLINGELDDNVDPVSTLQVVDALVKANKNFEQLYLPGRTHNLGGAYIDRRILDFFHRVFKAAP